MFKPHVAQKSNMTTAELQGIKNIIFDLGGVIINIHYEETIRRFKDLGFTDFDKIYTQIRQNRIFDLLETGKIPPQAFRNELRKFHNHISDQQIDFAWSAMIGEMPPKNIELLKKIRKNYRTFLLSNTNAIHIDFFIEYLKQKFGSDPLPEMFEHTYYSHEIGERKPDADAFDWVVRDAGLNKSQTLFIDDLEANIAGAKKAGLFAYRLIDEPLAGLFEPMQELV